METLKEWVVDIALCVVLAIVTAGLEARHNLEVSCEGRAAEAKTKP